MAKRVLYIAPNSFVFYYALRGQLSYLKSLGFEIEVACEKSTRADEAADREGVIYHPIKINNKIGFIGDLKAFIRLIYLIKKRKFNILNASTKKGGFLAGLAGRILGVDGIVYTLRGLTTGSIGRIKRKIFYFTDRVNCKIAHRVFLLSKSNMKTLEMNNVCSRKKMIIFGGGSENGVDTKRFSRTNQIIDEGEALRIKFDIPQDDYVFGFVGRLEFGKGIKELAEAWLRLRSKFDKVHLLMITPDEVAPAIELEIKELKNDPRVHFTGFMKNPAAGYAAMNCLVMPSHKGIEGFGNVIIEAGAMELPAIASRVTGPSDAVLHKDTGLLIKPNDVDELTDRMIKMLTNPDLGIIWGRNARNRCVKFFRQEIIWKGFADLYNELIAQKET